MIVMREFIKDTHVTVVTPVAKSVIRGLCKLLNVKGKIALVKDGKGYASKYWNVGNTTDTTVGVRPLVITAKHNEEHTKPSLGRTRVRHNNIQPLFKDESGAFIDILAVGTSNVIQLEIFSKSENLLEELEYNLRLKRVEHLDIFPLEVIYFYYMPIKAYTLVNFLSKEEDMATFLPARTDSRFTLVSTINGSRQQYGFKTHSSVEVSIISDIDTESVIFDKDAGVYSYTFNVKYVYEKPIYMDSHYDYILKGGLLPNSLLPKDDKITIPTPLNHNAGTMHYTIDPNIHGGSEFGYYIRIPAFDKHEDIFIRPPYTPIFSVMLETDPNNPNVLFNLRELGSLELTEEVLEFILEEKDYIIEYGASIFKIDLFCGDTLIPNTLTIDEDLNVIVDEEITCDKTPRVIVSIIDSGEHLFLKHFERLKKKGALGKLKEFGYIEVGTNVIGIEYIFDLPDRLDQEYIFSYSYIVNKILKTKGV